MKKFVYVGALVALGSQYAVAETLQDMISPVTHPTTFEDPRHSTELRPLFIYHELDDKFASGGGDIQIYALQARFKISEDLSIIATKDGIVDANPDSNIDGETGIANLAVGAKYSFFREENAILTGGLRYEIPLGDEDVFQGQGNGAINPFFSYGISCGDVNLMAGTGLRVRTGGNDSSFWDTDLHADYKIGNFYPLLEANLVHVFNDGNRIKMADEGEDFFNFGADGAAGENILTMAAGARYRVTDDIDIGAAYQFPLDRSTGSRIIDWRLTVDAIFRFEI
jgi:hypothetical protein